MTNHAAMPTAPFGRTGHHSSRVIFGAAALGGMRQDKADQILQQLLDAGVNHIDTAASYGDSELRVGPWMAEHRDDFFLATKTGLRTGAEARAQLEASLERLQVDQVDLIQLHNLVEPDEWETAHGPGGAVEAMVAARDEGLVRFIGVTGHGTRIPAMHVRSLAEFPFDSVLFPYNFSMMSNPQYRADVEELLERCADANVAAQTIKSIARRRWVTPEERKFSWYQPLEDAGAISRAAQFVLANDQCFLNTSSDTRFLAPVIEAACGPRETPSDSAMEADCAAFDITPLFDGSALETI